MSEWQMVCAVDEIPQPGARVVTSQHGRIAVFRNEQNEVYALLDQCPHKGGMLSKGTVTGRTVQCPAHGWDIGLDNGNAIEPDFGCVRTFQVRVEDGGVLLLLGN